jgi:hypothetical protein
MNERQMDGFFSIFFALVLLGVVLGCDRDESTRSPDAFGEDPRRECLEILRKRTTSVADCLSNKTCSLAESRPGMKVAVFVYLNVSTKDGGSLPEDQQIEMQDCVADEMRRNGLSLADSGFSGHFSLLGIGSFEKAKGLRDLSVVASLEVRCYDSMSNEICGHCYLLDEAGCNEDPFCSPLVPVREATMSLNGECVDLGRPYYIGCQPADIGCKEYTDLLSNGKGCFVGNYCGGMERLGWRFARPEECPDESTPACQTQVQ